MKKLLLTVSLLMMVACTSTPKNTESIKVLSPYGAPSIALLEQIKQNKDSITLVAGTDLILAELVRLETNYDLIIAPINMGISLLEKGQTKTKLLAVVSWGNLYILGEENTLSDPTNTLAMFGKDAVPEKIANFTFDDQQIQAKQEYFASVLDAQSQLLTNKAQAAMMAEPFVTKVLMENSQLEIIYDVQANYKIKTGLDNYPQAALFVNAKAYDENPNHYIAYVQSLRDYVVSIHKDTSILLNDINLIGAKELGLPSGEIVVGALERMNLDVVFARDKKQEIQTFMDLFNTDVRDDMLVDGS